MLGTYIAEVIEENPMKLKVQETGPFANLKEGSDFVILTDKSILIQDEKCTQELLRHQYESGRPLLSGLKSLGVDDGEIHQILPA